MSETNKPDATQPLDLEAIKSDALDRFPDSVTEEKDMDNVLALIAEIERLRVRNEQLEAEQIMLECGHDLVGENTRLKEALEQVEEIALTDDMGCVGRVLAIQQVLGDLRNAAKAARGE